MSFEQLHQFWSLSDRRCLTTEHSRAMAPDVTGSTATDRALPHPVILLTFHHTCRPTIFPVFPVVRSIGAVVALGTLPRHSPDVGGERRCRGGRGDPGAAQPCCCVTISEYIEAATRAAGVTTSTILSSSARVRAPSRQQANGRRKRTSMSLRTKLQVSAGKEARKSWTCIATQLDNTYCRGALKLAYRNRAVGRLCACAGHPVGFGSLS